MNLLGKAKPEIQQKRWQEIVEKYYREVDESSFELFLKDTKKEIKWKLEYTEMVAGFKLAVLGFDRGYEILEGVGIKVDSIEKARQKINAKITNHELKSNKKEDKEVAEFYEIWAEVRKVGYNIKENIKLPAWIGVMKSIRKTNERTDSENRRNKG